MTLDELRNELEEVKDYIWERARELGRDPKVYYHWTAGPYYSTFPDYHLCIDGDGELINSSPLSNQDIIATYRRNSGSIAIALCCAQGAIAYEDGTTDFGDYPPRDEQIECAAQIGAVICDVLGIPCDIYHVMTHAEAANNIDGIYPHDPYGPFHGWERWDLYKVHPDDGAFSGGDCIRGKILFYMNQGV